MAKPITIPNTFASATSAIPLAQLDQDFSTLANSTNDLATYSNYVADTGAADAYIANYPANTNTSSLTTGLRLQFKAANANTGASTLNVQVNGGSIGTAAIRLTDGSALPANTIIAGALVDVMYDGTNFQIMNDPSGGQEIISNLTLSGNLTVAGTSTFTGNVTGNVVNTTTSTITNLTSSNVTITGGSIDNIAIGNLTSLTVDGNTTLGDNSAADTVSINAVTSIDANSATAALRITQVGAGNALVVEDSANPDSTPFVVDTNGRVLLGTTSSVIVAGAEAGLQNYAVSGFQTNGRFSADASGSNLILAKSRNATVGANTIVQSGDNLGNILFAGADGSSFVLAAGISAVVDGTPGTNDMPGRLVFSTTADGASSPTERMRIDSAGNIGIGGTPTAARTLSVLKSLTGAAVGIQVNAVTTIQSDVTSQARIFNTSPSTQAASFTLGNLWHYSATQGTIGATSSITTQIGYYADSTLIGATNNFGFYSNIASGTGRWNFYANGTADNYFAGNVGIGTSSTSSFRLSVVGAASSSSTIRVEGGDGANTNAVLDLTGRGSGAQYNNTEIRSIGQNAFGGTLSFHVDDTSGTLAERMRIDSSGNVGIGTSSPTQRLHVVGNSQVVPSTSTGAVWMRANNASDNFYLGIDNSVGDGFTGTAYGRFLYSNGAYPMIFYTNSLERMRITSGGYFKASNTGTYQNSTGAFHEFYSNGQTTEVLFIKSDNASYTGDAVFVDVNRNTTNNSFYAINYYNRVANAYRFRVADSGNVTNTNGSYGTISDIKNKENIVDATPKLDKIKQLQVRNFNFKGDDLKQIGFIAQEFEQVFPSMVEEHHDKDADGNNLGTTTKSIKTSVLVPILVKAIQEQQAMIVAMQKEIAELKAK